MDLLQIAHGLSTNGNQSVIDLHAQATPFNTRGGREVLACFLPTSDFDGTATLQQDDNSAMGSVATVQAFSAGTPRMIKLTITEQYLRLNVTSRTAGTCQLYLIADT